MSDCMQACMHVCMLECLISSCPQALLMGLQPIPLRFNALHARVCLLHGHAMMTSGFRSGHQLLKVSTLLQDAAVLAAKLDAERESARALQAKQAAKDAALAAKDAEIVMLRAALKVRWLPCLPTRACLKGSLKRLHVPLRPSPCLPE